MDTDVPAGLRAAASLLDARIARLDEELAGLRRARGEDAADDEHDPEGVTLSSEWSRLAGVRDDLRGERRALAEALVRAEAGEYGVCADCGAAIPSARLAARPEATRCVACAQRAGR
ncbi:TraR/DksA family transcriptional regulator [Microbacterium telephonicum]|uniref:TraR/DksA family transcriptional regulator n=1 Tax=Microbacterium telephonicum TaxID=1714841 RepID=A0A498C391_9MICO|nr:TraR/DksA C4-type zinc finger protein [Microbacterium telephonicum]RLK49623.1 TraR/DksA family transcriptional regulator [Microbacterium telephonicum]